MPYRRMGGEHTPREKRARRRSAPRPRRPEAEEPIAPPLPPPPKKHKKYRKHTYTSRPDPAPQDPGWLRALYKLVTGVVIGLGLGLGLSYTIPKKKTVKLPQGVFKQQFAKQGARPRRAPPPADPGTPAPGPGAARTNPDAALQGVTPAAPRNEKMRQYRYEREAWAVIDHLERKLGLVE